MKLVELRSRAGSLVSALPAPEAQDARRVLALVDELGPGLDAGAPPFSEPTQSAALRIELRGLAERLGRRSAEGIPFASLARALSAALLGSDRDAARIRGECDAQLLSFGL